MIIGAPGVFNWKGAVIRISDYYLNTSSGIKSRRKRQDNTLDLYKFDEKFIPDVAKISQLEPSGYFGIDLHAFFFNLKKTTEFFQHLLRFEQATRFLRESSTKMESYSTSLALHVQPT